MSKKHVSKMPKSTSQRYHAQERFRERYGKDLTKEQYNTLCGMIKNRNTNVSLLDKQTNRASIYIIKCKELHEEEIIAGFDKKRGKIFTFLPIGLKKEEIQWEKYDDVKFEIWEGVNHEEDKDLL